MKGLIGIAFALTLSTVPALAGDTFHAFSTLSPAKQARLIPLPDDQLAAVQGKEMFVDGWVLMQFLIPMFHIPVFRILDQAPQVSSSVSTQNISSVFQTQLNTGGAVQTNAFDIRQE